MPLGSTYTNAVLNTNNNFISFLKKIDEFLYLSGAMPSQVEPSVRLYLTISVSISSQQTMTSAYQGENAPVPNYHVHAL